MTIKTVEILAAKVEQLAAREPHVHFEELAMEIWSYQSRACSPYRQWLEHMDYTERLPTNLMELPKMHISAWKSAKVTSESWQEEIIYTSSGTSGQKSSQHYVKDVRFYLDNTKAAFESEYGPVSNYCVLGLLPAYLERQGSSLVAMVEYFIQLSMYDNSGTYLREHADLHTILQHNRDHNIPTVLIGVSFGLLDFLESHTIDYPDLIVMETGGMKGRRKEITRTALHEMIRSGLGVERVHSEYGMTELLSQAYSTGGGVYRPASTMQILVTEQNDVLSPVPYGKSGIINIVDLANVHTCSFIMTDDLGIAYPDGSFEVLGRIDHSDMRGCSLMVSDL